MARRYRSAIAVAFLLLLTATGACKDENDITCYENADGCSCTSGSSAGAPLLCTEASQAANNSAAYCCATSSFPDGNGVCSCMPIKCTELANGDCHCTQPGLAGSAAASCAPKAKQKCCVKQSSCICLEQDACSDGWAEVSQCDPASLASCGSGTSRVAACSGGDGAPVPARKPDASLPPDIGPVSWAIGTWYAPAYDDNSTSKHIPPKGIGINADGTYAHNANGVVDDQGKWKVTGDTITLGSHGSLVRSRNCTFVNYDDGNRTDTYYRDDFPESCPTPLAPLTAVEKCLVGTFTRTTNQNLATMKLTWKRTEYRTQLFEQIYTGNGDAAFTTIYYWAVAGGKFCTEGVDQKSACESIDWPLIKATRTSPKAPGCVEP